MQQLHVNKNKNEEASLNKSRSGAVKSLNCADQEAGFYPSREKNARPKNNRIHYLKLAHFTHQALSKKKIITIYEVSAKKKHPGQAEEHDYKSTEAALFFLIHGTKDRDSQEFIEHCSITTRTSTAAKKRPVSFLQ